jgi:excisionase family DNA binding protein
MSEKLITVREASELVGISEQELINYAEAGKVPCYRFGGEFIRFRKSEILQIQKTIRQTLNVAQESITFSERIYNLFYYNDFYLVAGLLIAVLTGAILFV